MKLHKLNKFWLMLLVLALAALACGGGGDVVPVTQTPATPDSGTPGGNGLSGSERTNLISATVQIYALFERNGELQPAWGGSGTILNKSGLILTNAHVAAPTTQGEPDAPDALAIALVKSEDKPPVFSYLAEVRAADGFLDLAVLQIVSTIDGDSIDPNDLNLPFVPLGDSDNLHVGDHISIFGFPGIGGDTITFTDGNVSGFTAEEQIGDRAWIKTDATIAGGNSGGLASNDNAEIIGIPTQASSGAEGNVTDCRVIQDTNGDGNIDDRDTCIPIGGFINALRPINLAKPLIDAALSGRAYTSPYRVPGVASEPGTGEESARDFVWLDTTGSTADNCTWTDTIVKSYTEPTPCIATGFEYSGMTNGEPLREQWYWNGEAISEYTYAWEWDEEGLFGTFLPYNDGPIPDGTYYVEIFAGSDLHKIGTSGEVVVDTGGGGVTPTQQPSGDTITIYGTVYDTDTNKPISAYVFILKPGITFEKWQSDNFPDSALAASLQTDADGKYRITGIPRNVEFTFVVYADGYNIYYENNLMADNDTPAEVQADVGMTK